MGNYYTTNTNYIITTDFYMISYSAIYVIVRRKFCSFLLQKTEEKLNNWLIVRQKLTDLYASIEN